MARKLLLKKANFKPYIQELIFPLGRDILAERTFYFGHKRLRAMALDMESVPGTAEMVLTLLHKLGSGLSVLDFGCGEHKSAYLRRTGHNIHSCDILDLDLDNFTKIDPAAPRLPFEDNQFDIVVASEVLEHVYTPYEMIKELARVAAKKIIITTPNPRCLKSRKMFAKTGYLLWFTPKDFAYHKMPIFDWQIWEFCRQNNMRISQILGNNMAFDLKGGVEVIDYAESLIFEIDVLKE